MKFQIRTILSVLVLPALLFSCRQQKEQAEEQKPVQVSAAAATAQNPYLTTDHKGNAVLSWVEGEKENSVLCYAVSADGGITFGEKVTVAPSKGLSPHQESMPKVAFKSDGTVVAVFGNRRRINRPGAMFEGELYYSQSFDGGQRWSAPHYLHTDTASGYSRSFFDLATLPDGEVGAIWLDGRNKLEKGSSVYFAKTSGRSGFGTDKLIAKGTCECCRTELFADQQQTIHVAFRHIFSGVVRDMAYMQSADGGQTFTEPVRISPDNWVLEGCPHTGPSMAATGAGLQVVWFTNGGGKGVYSCLKPGNDAAFGQRSLISEDARHPQIAAAPDGTVALAWDEAEQQDSVIYNKIVVQVKKPKSVTGTVTVTEAKRKASHPVILPVGQQFVVAWVEETGEGNATAVFYRKI